MPQTELKPYADSIINEWGLPRSYSLYDGGYTTVLDIRLDNPLCHLSYANNGIITITNLFAWVVENTAQWGISDFVYVKRLNVITYCTSRGQPITLSNHSN